MKTDSEIQKDVMAELKWEPFLNATEIGVAVHDGIVTLSGYVSTYAKRYAAEKAAWRVKGVKAVAEKLEVRLGPDGKLTDEEVASSIISTLKWHTTIPDEQIKVRVSDGWVYLDGQVDWNYQRVAAGNAIRSLKGVRGVSNLITIKPVINVAGVKDNIRQALERSADVEASHIQVETKGNEVVLKGNIRSFEERRAAEQAAWSAAGVVSVKDELVIEYV